MCWDCPVVRGIRPHLREGVELTVDSDGAHVGALAERIVVSFQKQVFDWIRDYDNGRPVQPITFELSLPVDVLREEKP